MAESNTKKHKLGDRNQGSGKFQANWIKLFPDIVDVSKVGSTHAFSKYAEST